ncbi:Dihydrofolate synthase @ Folylpolyglutamate synthase [hydrothermal vent metagenome]|uniref:Dihydrofolate synthase @ Folylpolyglutamate synthase n=1 Tax=hydrothermal vent metagenome TaxID=652676 RepID=A0A1W1CSG5_9ZZZZ
MGRLKTLDEWLNYQENCHTKEIDLGLDRIKKVYKILFSNPFDFKVITVAGTNGKGSTLAFLESIYNHAGYKVGKFTSPHLFVYNERIRVDKKNVDDDLICQAFTEIEKARGDISLSYFEFSALAALWVFNKQKVEVALLEVGLGGRLDAINIVDSDIAVITNIELDHVEYLGNTRELIAIEKMGIMRQGRPCLSGEKNPPKTMLDKNILFVNEKYQGKLPLLGEVQKNNAQLALEVVEALGLSVSAEDKKQGLENTKLLGRQQVIKYKNKIWIFDVAHNVASVEALTQTIKNNNKKTIAIFSALKDKNIALMIDKITPFIDEWFLIPLQVKRALTTKQLQYFFHKNNTILCQSANDAISLAEKSVAEQVLVFGSFHTVATIFSQINEY